jgi:hypothetical protein
MGNISEQCTSGPFRVKRKVKLSLLTGHGVLKDYEMPRIPHCLDSPLIDGA